jgi:hypothetical protein
MVAAVVVVWIVLSILVGLTMAPLRRPSRMHPSSFDPSSLRPPPSGSVHR